jgi:glutamate--cysteine ligase
VRFVLDRSRRHREALEREPFAADVEAALARTAEESLAEQREIEAADTLPFEAFRQRYLSPLSLVVSEPSRPA